jgi:uncharacterized protein
MATVLITGASGLIGTALSSALQGQGHTIHKLGRGSKDKGEKNHFKWDVDTGFLDPKCLDGVTHIVHLAGAGIADARWSTARVEELITSRAASARLLLKAVLAHGSTPVAFISAAGINYYGATTTDRVFVETDPAGKDTIARISVAWEEAVDEWSEITRVVKLRTPMVLAREGGALKKLAMPVRFGAASALGSGRQWVPWIHLNDLVRIYQEALFNEAFSGAYNVNTGNDVTNDTLMRTLARVMRRPYFLPNVPAVFLRLALGELSTILLEGSRASHQRLIDTGFRFKHPALEPALRDLVG